MLSTPSNTASQTDIKESSQAAEVAQAVLEKRRKLAPKLAEPISVQKSIPTIQNSRSEQRIAEYERRQAELQQRDRVARCIDQSGLPARHVDTAELTGDEWIKARHAASAAIGCGDGVLLWGKRGTGKTQIATECGRDFTEQGRSVCYLKAGEMFRLCREAMQANRESLQVSRYKRVALLIVDEAHVRVDTDYEDRILMEIVDARYDACKPTILITNQNKADAAKSLGPSIVSRFYESGVVVECNWQSYRGKS